MGTVSPLVTPTLFVPAAADASAMYDYRYNATTYSLEIDTDPGAGSTWASIDFGFSKADLTGNEFVTWVSPGWRFQFFDSVVHAAKAADLDYYADTLVAPYQTSYYYQKALTFRTWWYGGLRDMGVLKTFANPIWVHYQHDQSKDLKGDAGHDSYGRTFWFRIDRSTGSLSDLFGYPVGDFDMDSSYEAWFQPKNGTLWGDYKFKSLEVEEIMPAVADSNCSAITTDHDLTFLMKADMIATPAGTAPTITGAPKVIAGRIIE